MLGSTNMLITPTVNEFVLLWLEERQRWYVIGGNNDPYAFGVHSDGTGRSVGEALSLAINQYGGGEADWYLVSENGECYRYRRCLTSQESPVQSQPADPLPPSGLPRPSCPSPASQVR